MDDQTRTRLEEVRATLNEPINRIRGIPADDVDFLMALVDEQAQENKVLRMQRDDLETQLINVASFLRGLSSSAIVMNAYQVINKVTVWKTNHEPNDDLPF